MKYLAIDCSNKHLTVLIDNGDKIFSHYEKDCGVRHSVSLMPAIEKLEKRSGVKIKDVDFIACVVGAGSFTGIRIGIATVKGLCFALNKPALSLTSFDTIAYNKKGKILAVIDAGHNGYYVCGYDEDVVDILPTYVMKEELLKIKEGRVCLSYEIVDGIGAEVVSQKSGLIKAIKAKYNMICNAEDLTPLYIRKSQAEEGR